MPKPRKNKSKTSEKLTHRHDKSSNEQDNLDPLEDACIDSEHDHSTLDHRSGSENITTNKATTSNLFANSVFKVIVSSKQYDYENPWHPPTQSGHSGSGFAIMYGDKTFLVTNAHVANKHGLMQVRLANHSEKYTAKPLLVDHDCDLAILGVDNQDFWGSVEPLPLGKFVKYGKKLSVHGFPMGGNELCVTKGEVTRIEVDEYVEAGTNLLQEQVSAEINSGNSGGPAIRGGKVVGVAFQGISDGDGLGYIIPVPVLEHFLKEALDIDHYKGFPDLSFEYQELNNDILRAHMGLKAGQTGIRVKKVPPLSAAFGILKEDDVILAIDGKNIKDDGTCETDFSKRISLDYLISRHFIGDTLTIKLLRNKKEQTVNLTLQHRASTTQKMQIRFEDEPPTFYFVSGVALCPLSDQNSDLSNYIKKSTLQKKKPGEEIVFIKEILAAEHSKGYGLYEGDVVTKVNGKRINNLRTAIEEIEKNKEAHHVLETDRKHKLVLPNMSKKDHQKFLKKEYFIYRDRSSDLKREPVYSPGCPEYNQEFLPGYMASKKPSSHNKKSHVTNKVECDTSSDRVSKKILAP